MAEIEKEFERLFDTLDERELDELIDDITIEPDKQPDLDGLFDGKGHIKMKKNISRKSIAIIAATVAALGITVTAGAAAISNYADHKQVIEQTYGSSAEEILNKHGAVTDNTAAAEHIKISQLTSLSAGDMYDTTVILEGTDDTGRELINSSNIYTEVFYAGTQTPVKYDGGEGYTYGEGCTTIRYDFSGIEELDTNKGLTLKFTPAKRVGDNENEVMGEPIGEITVKPADNVSAKLFKSADGCELTLSDMGVICKGFGKELDFEDVNITVTYSDGSTREFEHGYCDLGYSMEDGKTESDITIVFKELADTENVTNVTLAGVEFTAQQK